MAEPLTYQSVQPASPDPLLDEGSDFVTLTFPTSPRWQSVGGLVTSLASVALLTFGVVWANVSLALMFKQFGVPMFPWPRAIIGSVAVLLLFWAGTAYVVWDNRRWTGAVMTLKASSSGLLWERRSHRAHRLREIERERIKQVRAQHVQDVFGRRGVFDLFVDLHKGRALRWRIASRDQEFAERLVRGFRNALGLAVSSDVRHNSA